MIEEEQCNWSEESLSTCRVDKKAAQQTESGSNNVSCRSVLKGSSQGSCLTSSALSTQGNHKKNIKTKADMEIPKGSLVSTSPSWLWSVRSLYGLVGFCLLFTDENTGKRWPGRRTLKPKRKEREVMETLLQSDGS